MSRCSAWYDGLLFCVWLLVLCLTPGALEAAGTDLWYSPADLELKPVFASAVPDQNEVEEELRDLLARQAPLLALFKVKIKDGQRLIDQILELDRSLHFLNLKSLRKFERKVNLQAWQGLWNGIKDIRLTRLDAASLAGLQKAADEYRRLRELAKAEQDTAKIGKYSYFEGNAQEALARQEANPATRQRALQEARQTYAEAYDHLSRAPDPKQGVTAADALEKVLTLDQEFGGILPLRSPQKQNVVLTSDVGMRIHPKHKRRIHHKGIDLAYPGCNGQSVQSIGPGRVIKNGWERGYGYVVNLVHDIRGKQVFTRYAHLAKKGRLAEGTVVPKGRELGFCNNSGVSTGAHLHFEVLTDGEFGPPLDPKKFLPLVSGSPRPRQDKPGKAKGRKKSK